MKRLIETITNLFRRKPLLATPAVSGSYTIEEDIKHRIEKGLIDGKLKPIKCECGSTEFYDKITDRVESTITEKDRYCKNCNKLVGCWSYGYWLP